MRSFEAFSKAVQQPDFSEPTLKEWVGKPISRSFKLEIKKAVHNLNAFLGMPDDGVVRRRAEEIVGDVDPPTRRGEAALQDRTVGLL